MDDYRKTEEIPVTEVNPDDPYEGLQTDKSWISQEDNLPFSPESFKEKQISRMIAATMWFLLFCAFLVAGAFVVKLVIWIV